MDPLSEYEDISENYLYLAIKLRHAELLAEVERRGGLICCPTNDLIGGVKLTMRFAESHVLFPSPILAKHYTTALRAHEGLSGANAKEDDGFVSVHDELGGQRAKILSQEEFYVDERTYRVCLVDAILCQAEHMEITNQELMPPRVPHRPSLGECAEFLSLSPVNAIVLAKVREQQRQFAASYLFVRGFEAHAVRRVAEIVQRATDDLTCANPDYRRLAKSQRQQLQLALVVSSFVVGGIHDKIWRGIAQCFMLEDERLRAKAAAMSQLDPVEKLEVNRELVEPAQRASAIIAQLPGDAQTPLELLYRLHDAFEAIVPIAGGSGIVAGDDLLPAVVYAIALAQPRRIYTLSFYMENMLIVNLSHTALGYTATTLRAAVEYLSAYKLEDQARLEMEAMEARARTAASASATAEIPRGAPTARVQSIPSGHFRAQSMIAMPVSARGVSPPHPLGEQAEPPTMKAPPKTVSASSIPGAAMLQASGLPQRSLTPPPTNTTTKTGQQRIDLRLPQGFGEKRMGNFLTALRNSEGTFTKSDLGRK